MTERTWSQSPDDAADPGTIILAQAEGATELAPTGPLEPTGPLDPTALTPDVSESASEAAPEAAEAPGLPQGLVEVEDALDESAEVEPAGGAEAEPGAGAPSAEAGARPGTIEVAPLAAGERRVVDVPEGGFVSLGDASFAPAVATYSVDGNDLVVTVANGGVLVLTDFFAPSEVPILLSVLDGPAVPAEDLLARAEAQPAQDQDPALGPPDPEPVPEPIGGASAFREYDQGDIGDPLDPLGPLGPTALGFGADFPELDPFPIVEDDLGDDAPSPPATEAPEVQLRSNIEATIGEQSGPAFNPATTPVLPARSSGQPLADADVNNVDQRNLTLDGFDREVFVRFIDDNSFSIDSLFVHDIGPNGEISNVRLVFDGVNKPGDPLSELKQTELGTEFSLGVIPAGTQFGFVVLNDGLRLNDFSSFDDGEFVFRNPRTGAPSTIADNDRPDLVFVAADGTETVLRGAKVFTADASQQTPDLNRLNPDGKGAFVSGWDDEEGLLALAVEDGRPADRDFVDTVLGVRYGSPLEKVLVVKGGADLGAQITDTDSESMVAATITLAGLEGDRLVIDPGVLAGTGLTLTQVNDSRIDLAGEALIEVYETVISAATIEIDLEAGRVGPRSISVTVEDPDGNTGSADTTFTVDDNLLTGPGEDNGDGSGDGSGDDQIEYPRTTSVSDPDSEGRDVVSGRGGNDRIDGLSGDDFIDGGDGKDTIIVRGPGDNTLSGGPQPDHIILSTGPGADVVRFTGLSDGKDTIRNFDASEGDRLDFSLLLRDSDIDDATFDQFVRVQQDGSDVRVQADLDGAGAEHRFVDVVHLTNPTGVTGSTDPSSFIITPTDSDAAVA